MLSYNFVIINTNKRLLKLLVICMLNMHKMFLLPKITETINDFAHEVDPKSFYLATVLK